jgi:hypothetical protein
VGVLDGARHRHGLAAVERGDYELAGVPNWWLLYALVREQATTTP